MTNTQNAPDCARTLAIWKNAQIIKGVKCSYHYAGKIPCTGRQVCHLCGKEKPAEKDAHYNAVQAGRLVFRKTDGLSLRTAY